MMDNAGEIMTGEKSLTAILDKIMDKYNEFQEHASGSDGMEVEDSDEDIDYMSEILNAEKTEAMLEA
jgi:hypothetical protein